MAKVSIPYVDTYKDRHGKPRCYYRRDGRRITLPLPHEAGFMAAYDAAAAEFQTTAVLKSVAPAAGTFDALCAAYYHSAAFLTLQPKTQRTYRLIIERWRNDHGRKRVSHLRRADVVAHVAAAMEASGPHAADSLLTKLKILLRFAVENDWRRDNPAVTIRKVSKRSEGFATWSEEDIAKFEDRWAIGTRERLALALLLYTGQRRSDVVRMGRQHVSGDGIRVVQQKTGTRLVIPVHPTLRAIIEDTPKDNLTFLTTSFGRGFTANGFGNWFREKCDAAGLANRSAHGLRKAAARRLAEAGCTASQIAAVTGHKKLEEVAHYTAAADQERLARDALGRIS